MKMSPTVIASLLICAALFIGPASAAADEMTEQQALSLLARIAIVTPDYAASKEFYGDILGFEAVYSGDISRPIVREQMQLPESANIHFTIFKKPDGEVGGYDMAGAMVGLLQVTGVELPRMHRENNAPLSLGEPMLAIMTRDLATVEKKLKSAGTEFILEPMSAHDGTEMEMVVRDPAGVRVHILEIVARP